jgi:4-hydroxybutyrate CoA-transferase
MRIVNGSEALARLQSQQQVFVQGAAATPSILLQALAERARDLHDVGVVHLHTEGPAPHLAREMQGHIHHRALFIGANARAAVAEGRAEYIPVFLSDIPRLFRRRSIPVDVALINVSPPDRHGFCSLGTSVDVVRAAVQAASVVIAQINAQMPRALGDSFVHVSDIDEGVEVSEAPYTCVLPIIGDVERRIGELVAELVPDGATLQLGIGAIPSAVAAALASKRNLGIHTEMFTDAVLDLVESGVINGSEKDINPGKIVTSFVMGTRRLYDFLHDNAMVEMRPSDYTNDSAVIRRFRKMVAINSALEIDLTGQVCADSVGPRLWSGVGGQMDFVRGAAMAEEGRAIIALPSMAVHGTVSRIVPMLRPGSGVVTTRAHVHTVVTEWGVADLHGKGTIERARALTAIAHPSVREQLARSLQHVGATA